MSLDTIALLIDTYWMFLAGALILGIVTGWIAVNNDSSPKNSSD